MAISSPPNYAFRVLNYANMPKGVYLRTEYHKNKLKVPHLGSGIYKHKIGYKRLPFSMECRKKMSKSAKHRPLISEKTKIKMSEAQKRIGKKLPSHKGEKLSEEHKRKISESHRGEKCYLWRGGITPDRKKIYNSFEYKNWRTSVFNRDEFTCVICGKVGGKLESHYIRGFAQFPKLRFNIDNGITLCRDCHWKTDNYGYKGRII